MRLAVLLLAAAAVHAENKWSEFRSDGFTLFTSAGAKPGRETLLRMEEFRHAAGKVLGVAEAKMPLPTRVLLFPQHPDAGTIERGRDFVTIVLTPATASTPAFQRDLARWLIDSSSDRMPKDLEDGVLDLLSGLEIQGVRITAGAPPPAPSPAFPLIRYLATKEEYAGRLPLLLRNLGRGIDETAAWRNALEKPRPQIEAEAKAAAPATLSISGRPLSADQWSERPVDRERIEAILAELRSERERYAEYRKILSQPHTEESLKRAVELQPARPAAYLARAAIEPNTQAKLGYLRTATTLDRRDPQAWAAMARAYEAAFQWADAVRTWRIAEQAAATPDVRAQMRGAREEVESHRLDWEEGERRRAAEARERETRRLKDAELAHLREIERKYSQPGAASDKVVAWDDLDKDPPKMEGTLRRVECGGAVAKLVIETAGGKLERILIPDPTKIVMVGGKEAAFTCGPQNARKITVEYKPRKGAGPGIAGEALSIEFR